MRSIYNNTEGPGFFCVTVKNSYPMPSDLKGIDKIVWASKPTVRLGHGGIIKNEMLCVVQHWSRYASTTPPQAGSMEVADRLENV